MMIKFMRTNIYTCLLCALIIFGSSGCKPQDPVIKFNATDITGVDFGKDFKLTDHNGKLTTLADFKGKAVVMFFGYTHCPDVCPTTLSELNQALFLLGKDADNVQVLFVTVDPARDTQKLLAKYVPAFNPGFIGLYGDDGATSKIARDFRIFFQKSQGKKSNSYDMDHSAGTYVFDQAGKLRLFMSYGQGAQNIANDLKIILNYPNR